MAYIKKNVNFILILLALALVASIIGFTTYYQTTYRNLTSAYNARVAELKAAQQNISMQQQNLQSTQSELQLRVADNTKFESLYNDMVQQKNKLDADLATTKGQLASTQAQLADALTTLQTSQAALNNAQTQLANTQAQLTSAQTQRNNYCLQLHQFNSSVSC